jgi:hypothetical protein
MTDYKLEAGGVYGTGRVWTFGAHVSSSNDLATTLVDWSAQLVSFWTNGSHGVETVYATSTILTSASAISLSGTFHEDQRVDGTLSNAGTSTADEGANQLAILASLRNASSGPKNRGRLYLPSPAEDAVDEGVLGSTERTRVSTAIDALFDGMRTDGYTFFVFNRNASPRDPVAFTKKTITTQKIDAVLRTQRRRVRKELPIYV